MIKTGKLVIYNDTEDVLTLSLEPWGEDYTLLNKEEVEIVEETPQENFHYYIDVNKDYIAVYPEGDSETYPRVFSNDEELPCGYNREFSNSVGINNSISNPSKIINRRKLHQITFLLAGIYNICWGLWVSVDPNWLFRFSGMELPNYPEMFVCVGMVVGLYGVVYLEIARRPENGFLLALVGFIGKILGPIGAIYYVYLGKWTFSALIMNLTNDFIWLIPFAIYLLDSWQFYKQDLLKDYAK